jgi:hypothetical protein
MYFLLFLYLSLILRIMVYQIEVYKSDNFPLLCYTFSLFTRSKYFLSFWSQLCSWDYSTFTASPQALCLRIIPRIFQLVSRLLNEQAVLCTYLPCAFAVLLLRCQPQLKCHIWDHCTLNIFNNVLHDVRVINCLLSLLCADDLTVYRLSSDRTAA